MDLDLKILVYYTTEEVAEHNSAEDCYVIIGQLVYDLTALIVEYRGPLAEPLIAAAGENISHWFDLGTLNVKTFVHPEYNIRVPYTPMGRFVHVPPSEPVSSWSTNIVNPWWRNPQYIVGKVSQKARQIRVVNFLTSQEHILKICIEETLMEVLRRYLAFNSHAESYTWKSLVKGKLVSLNMHQTLEENGIVDEEAIFEELGIELDECIPTLHLYFNDDLTVA